MIGKKWVLPLPLHQQSVLTTPRPCLEAAQIDSGETRVWVIKSLPAQDSAPPHSVFHLRLKARIIQQTKLIAVKFQQECVCFDLAAYLALTG